MHYLYETETKLRAFLHNASCRLEAGGFFIGTTIDAERVVARIRTEGQEKLRIGNRFYSIQFGQESYPKDKSPYGLKFYFYLRDAVGLHRMTEDRPVYVPEYLVSFDHFQKIALEYDLQLVERKNFHEFYADTIDAGDNQKLFTVMVSSQIETKMSEEDWAEQWEICGLYTMFAFQKLGQYSHRRRDNFGNYKLVRKVNVRDLR